MKKGFKLLAVVLTIALMLPVFAGCKGDSEGLLKLEVWSTQGTDHTTTPIEDTNLLAKWLEEETGVVIDTVYGNGGDQWEPKLTKIVASGNIPDLVWCGSGQGATHFNKLDELKILYKLTPQMIKKYAPNVWERVPEAYWESLSAEDGSIMGIPFLLPATEATYNGDAEDYAFMKATGDPLTSDVQFMNGNAFWIRDDIVKDFFPEARTWDEMCAWLEENNTPMSDEMLDIPIKSTEEYVDFLYAIKEKGYRVDSKTPVYAFGYTGGDNWVALGWFGSDMTGYKGHNYSSTWNSVEQKIEIPIMHEAVKEAAKIQNQMLADKVIDPESLVNTNALYKEKALDGQYAIIAMSYMGDPIAINKQIDEMGKDFNFRPFITQVPAKEGYAPYEDEKTWQGSVCFTTELSEDEVIKTLKWMNVQFSDEFEKAFYWGPENSGLYEEVDGKPAFVDEKMQNYYAYGEGTKDELPYQDLAKNPSYMTMRPVVTNKWEPRNVYKTALFHPTMYSGFKFTADSKHVQNINLNPPAQIWDPIYAEIPEVNEFWNNRSQWESAFTKALAASPADFEARWKSAVDLVNSIVDVEKLETEMTKIAKPLADEIAQRQELLNEE